jgi:hypothetical protein
MELLRALIEIIKITPNGQNLVEHLMADVVTLANGPD